MSGVLVTGGAGYIGSHAVKALRAQGTPVVVLVHSVERVTGRKVPFTTAGRRPGDPGVLFASSARIRAELGWNPRFEDIDVIVETAWRWRQSHPQGYRKATA